MVINTPLTSYTCSAPARSLAMTSATDKCLRGAACLAKMPGEGTAAALCQTMRPSRSGNSRQHP